jgi:hypothetical protein
MGEKPDSSGGIKRLNESGRASWFVLLSSLAQKWYPAIHFSHPSMRKDPYFVNRAPIKRHTVGRGTASHRAFSAFGLLMIVSRGWEE